MADYVHHYKRPEYIEAFELGRKHAKAGKSGMAAYYYGGKDAEAVDPDRLKPLNFAYLLGWFTGSSERAAEPPVEQPAPTEREIRMAEHRAQEFSKDQGGPAKT